MGSNPLYVATQMGHVDTTMITRTYGKWIGSGLDLRMRRRLTALYARTDTTRGNEFPEYA